MSSAQKLRGGSSASAQWSRCAVRRGSTIRTRAARPLIRLVVRRSASPSISPSTPRSAKTRTQQNYRFHPKAAPRPAQTTLTPLQQCSLHRHALLAHVLPLPISAYRESNSYPRLVRDFAVMRSPRLEDFCEICRGIRGSHCLAPPRRFFRAIFLDRPRRLKVICRLHVRDHMGWIGPCSVHSSRRHNSGNAVHDPSNGAKGRSRGRSSFRVRQSPHASQSRLFSSQEKARHLTRCIRPGRVREGPCGAAS